MSSEARNWSRPLTALLEAGHQLLGRSPSQPENAPLEGISIEQIQALVSAGLISPATITAAGPVLRFVNTGAGVETWDVTVASGNGRLTFTHGSGTPVKLDNDAISDLLQVGTIATDLVTIGGDLEVLGTILPDEAFKPGFEPGDIKAYMAEARAAGHLVDVPKAAKERREDGSEGPREVINVGRHVEGQLGALEKAMFYIEQLEARIAALEAK